MDAETVLGTPERYRSIDFFRGIALLLIFYNHLVYLSRLGYRGHYGFSDAAAVFVALSGFVSGLVYVKAFRLVGFWGCARKAFGRSFQLYSAHILTLVPVLLIARIPPLRNEEIDSLSKLSIFFDDFFGGGLDFISLRTAPWYFDILPMYVIFLLAVPFVVRGFSKHSTTLLTMSVIVYSAVQVGRGLGFEPLFTEWVFNPLSWQLLFMFGVFFSTSRGHPILDLFVSKPAVVVSSGFLLYAVLDIEFVQSVLHFDRFRPARSLLPSPFPYSDKRFLDPIVLLHFVACVIVVRYCVVRWKLTFGSRIAKELRRLGRHSLPIFCAGVILDYFLSYVLVAIHADLWLFVLTALAGCVFFMGIARALECRSSKNPFGGKQARASIAT